ncbi:type IX secretion system membrane protein PorP/SprF [Fluviicola taffensis]|uniref:PorP/SprF family type IX secretion system membrane protein n=1 Tax=Fluviicola taffensis TaxID=191579 RepID=UPI003137AC31
MKKLILFPLILGIAFFTSTSLWGQQLGLNSTYMFNEASFNPAAAGSKSYIPVHIKSRFQWVGFDGAPVSQLITAHGEIAKGLGFGGNIYNESSGPSRSSGFNLMLSYRLRLSKDNLHGIRIGLGASFTQHVVDVASLTTEIPNDQAISSRYNNQFVPDADLGVYYTFSDKGYVGVSVKNLVQSKHDLFSFSASIPNTLNRHYYFNGGYNFQLKEKWCLKTSVLSRFIEAKTFQAEVNVIGEFNKRFFFGLGYRHKESVQALVGAKFGIIQFGYNYDFGISQIRKYGNGSHEIFVQFQFQKKKAEKTDQPGETPWFKRNRIFK